MEHKLLVHKNCMVNNCMICDGGLSYCTVCKGAEGTLPTECPERELSETEEILIINRHLDFINGEWVR